MQLYSDFTHSFDLSQVIDFKQIAGILPIDNQNWKKMENTLYIKFYTHKKMPLEHFWKKPLKRQL